MCKKETKKYVDKKKCAFINSSLHTHTHTEPRIKLSLPLYFGLPCARADLECATSSQRNSLHTRLRLL